MYRLFKAIIPFNWSPIFEGPRIDLYGPLWIMATLLTTVCIVAWFSDWADSLVKGDEIETFDIKWISSCCSLLFSYFIGVPLFLHIVFKCSAVKKVGHPGFIWFLAVYGYSFTIFIPAALGYVIPLFMTWWVILICAGIISLFFICKEIIQACTENLTGEWLKIVALVCAALHGGLVLLLRFYYFA